jgi:hypothetical protein
MNRMDLFYNWRNAGRIIKPHYETFNYIIGCFPLYRILLAGVLWDRRNESTGIRLNVQWWNQSKSPMNPSQLEHPQVPTGFTPCSSDSIRFNVTPLVQLIRFMSPEEIIALVKFPNKKFSISASRARCVEYAQLLQTLGMNDDTICQLISVLYQDAFNEADYQRLAEKFVRQDVERHAHL